MPREAEEKENTRKGSHVVSRKGGRGTRITKAENVQTGEKK